MSRATESSDPIGKATARWPDHARSWLSDRRHGGDPGGFRPRAEQRRPGRRSRPPAFGDVSVFASAPAPGSPVRDRGRRRPRLRLDQRRRLLRRAPELRRRAGLHLRRGRQRSSGRPSSTRPTNSDMGLFGLALDGNTGTNHKLYVADMNGRILRLDLGKHPAAPEVFSQVPATRVSPATG